MANGLIETGMAYRDRTLKGLVSEASLAGSREMATRKLTTQKEMTKLESQVSAASTPLKMAMKALNSAFSTMGMGGGTTQKTGEKIYGSQGPIDPETAIASGQEAAGGAEAYAAAESAAVGGEIGAGAEEAAGAGGEALAGIIAALF